MIRQGNVCTAETAAEELREAVRERMWRKPDFEHFSDTGDAIIRIVIEAAAKVTEEEAANLLGDIVEGDEVGAKIMRHGSAFLLNVAGDLRALAPPEV